jgi:hypothetical protein
VSRKSATTLTGFRHFRGETCRYLAASKRQHNVVLAARGAQIVQKSFATPEPRCKTISKLSLRMYWAPSSKMLSFVRLDGLDLCTPAYSFFFWGGGGLWFEIPDRRMSYLATNWTSGPGNLRDGIEGGSNTRSVSYSAGHWVNVDDACTWPFIWYWWGWE